jgi:cell division protein FtsQ
VRLSPHWRRRLIALGLLAVALGSAYLFWLRDSSLVRVEQVTVKGLDTPDAARVRAKLSVAARQMTTLHVNEDALRRAVAGEPVVQSLSVHASFPHGLTIDIVENRPVAVLLAGNREVAVAPGGTVLDGTKVTGGLPVVRVATLPQRGHMPDGPARERIAVAAAAPPRLLSQIESISIQNGRGAVAQMQHGPAVYFGRPIELGRKWTAAASVLADSSSQGAAYIDVRMPDRPVAGGLSLKQTPQPEAQAAGPGAAPGSAGVIPANPGTSTTAPGTTQQIVPQAPATPAQTASPGAQGAAQPASPATSTPAQTAPTNTGP